GDIAVAGRDPSRAGRQLEQLELAVVIAASSTVALAADQPRPDLRVRDRRAVLVDNPPTHGAGRGHHQTNAVAVGLLELDHQRLGRSRASIKTARRELVATRQQTRELEGAGGVAASASDRGL